MCKPRFRVEEKTVLIVSQCAGISDPFHFYLGYFLPLVGFRANKLNRRSSRKVLYQLPRLASLQDWVRLGLLIREVKAEAYGGDALQEFLRRRRWTSRVVRRATTLLFPDSDNVHKLGTISFRRLLRRAKSNLSQLGILHEPNSHTSASMGRACIVVRRSQDPLKPVVFPRDVSNLDEIGSFLEAKGWEVVYLDAATTKPEDVLKVVSSSKLLVGQYGAGLAHCMWMAKGCSVVELSAKIDNPMVPWVYRRLAESASLRFVHSRCQETWTSPASIKTFEKSYEAVIERPLTIADNVRSLSAVYFHIFVGRLLISAGLRKA